ncbi:hypothetical protein GCM10010123_01330 [Pilimelia anulata]|uniref:Uncharacterized protein n=1 Tax=Pilimelia anulata TaxID=53371 RepID=A0A8J3AYG1_9ACTN|nr:hypothetical protein [Pilimelia anulata]GGJ75086.1 hypothetical protein GCM10010123_01330 [Pilimelia anulata]
MNIATDGAQVGAQAAVVHELNVYGARDDSPQEQLNQGLRYLDYGIPGRARERIESAAGRLPVDSRIDYYLVLALLSGRTMSQLDRGDRAQVRQILARHPDPGADQWASALALIDDLLHRRGLNTRQPISAQLESLPEQQRAELERHLTLMMDGAVQDRAWKNMITIARKRQFARSRTDRAWMFFQPVPLRPRVRWPERPRLTLRAWFALIPAILTTVAGSVAIISFTVGRLGWLLAAVPFVGGIGGWLLLTGVLRWWTHHSRHSGGWVPITARRPRSDFRSANFVARVSALFGSAHRRLRPGGAEGIAWDEVTEGLRAALCDEVVDLYWADRIEARQVAWLIRYLVRDLRRRWDAGILARRGRPRVAPAVRGRAIGGGVLCAAALAVVIVAAWGARPALTSIALVLTLPAAWYTALVLVRRIHQQYRYRDEFVEARELLRARTREFLRWQARLENRPDDAEVARWLDCDRTLLMHEAMRFYQLRPSDTVTYAVLEAPAKRGTRTAREEGGPWRYATYKLVVFLLTEDGVRQLEARMDFNTGQVGDRERVTYRFDAVASVRVKATEHSDREFILKLVNGDAIDIKELIAKLRPMSGRLGRRGGSRVVADLDLDEAELVHGSTEALELTLDAAGVPRTLYILEGIAADGKTWVQREREREQLHTRAVLDESVEFKTIDDRAPAPLS